MKKTEIIQETKWSIDSTHSEIGFKVRHLMISNVKGTFKKFDASIYTTEKDFTTATVDLWIDAASISTGDDSRDEHLKGPDFLDVTKYKQISFTSSTIGKPDHNGNQELWGELTIKEVTKNVKLNIQFGGTATDPWGNEKAGFTVTGKINRSEWGLVWNTAMEAGGIMVGDEISVLCEIELIYHVNSKEKMTLEA
jgi:polyisoprenoid-binding protein YceI